MCHYLRKTYIADFVKGCDVSITLADADVDISRLCKNRHWCITTQNKVLMTYQLPREILNVLNQSLTLLCYDIAIAYTDGLPCTFCEGNKINDTVIVTLVEV